MILASLRYMGLNREKRLQGDLDFISSLASQASIALANILLTNQRIQEEQIEMLGKITNFVRNVKNSPDPSPYD